jgi:hypothetical protein
MGKIAYLGLGKNTQKGKDGLIRPFIAIREALGIIRDYAAALASAIQKRFLGPLARKKSPKVSVLEANQLVGAMIAQVSFEKVNFSKI